MSSLLSSLHSSLGRRPRYLAPWLLGLVGLISSTANAQDESAGPDYGSSGGIEARYGSGVKVAGQPTSEASSESDFGLEGMYGGVSGSAGPNGTPVGGPKKNVPEYHSVKKGDTLWGISEDYYGNPWAWPKVWSLNPQIENPHWIYPGDQIRTSTARSDSPNGANMPNEDNSAGGGGFVGRARIVPEGTVFIRDQGYIGDPKKDVWGEVVGSQDETMLLSDGNVVYLKMKEDVDLRIGQRLTVFHEISSPPSVEDGRDPPGEIVKVYGTVRVDSWDRDTGVARTTLIEAIDAIERGFSVGPVGRRFDVVPPRAATEDVEARIITSLYPHIYFGQDQLVFIDKGSEDKLKPGNRLRILRRGDGWKQTLTTSNHHARMRVEMGSPDVPDKETTPVYGGDDEFPDEVVGEIIVLRTEDYSSICLVTSANRGLEPNDRAVAVSGY